ncbi:MAG: 3-hydroxyacyl-CoA dehydrogenase NAD-binding domain-containing protein, partial [Pseudomonadota bacterium]
MTRKAAILGGGVIGGGWAARFLLMGWDVAVFDPDPQAERKIEAVLANARAALPQLYDAALPAEGRLSYAPTVEAAVDDAAWVQESGPERRDVKAAILGPACAALTEGAVLGSSTSGFTPSSLQAGLPDPSRLVVAHPFNPVYLLPLVEIVAGEATAPAAVETACTVLEGLGMKPLVVRREIDAHIADRLLEAVWRESLWLIKDGVCTTEELDDAIRYGFGLRWA